jgi:hypothetical protein
MPLDDIVRNAGARWSANNQLQQQIGRAVISAFEGALIAAAYEIDTKLLNPAANTKLGDAIYGLVSGAAKHGLDPQQLYNQGVGIYSQHMFGDGSGNGNLLYAAHVLASLSVDYQNYQKSRDRNAPIYKAIYDNSFVKALKGYYESRGQNVSEEVIRAYLNWAITTFSGRYAAALELAKSDPVSKIFDPALVQSMSDLMSIKASADKLTIQKLTEAMYSLVQVPPVEELMLTEAAQDGLLTEIFNYINRKIGSYIAQPQQQQPAGQAGQQQGGQQAAQPAPQGHLPNIPPQQHNPQPQNQAVPVQPVRLLPQNQQQNQQNNQQGRQTP